MSDNTKEECVLALIQMECGDNAQVNLRREVEKVREAKKLGAWLVHYSTDYVFDGAGDKPRTETDDTGPLNVYGKTKLESEELIRESGCQHLLFRTSWVCAAHSSERASCHHFVTKPPSDGQ